MLDSPITLLYALFDLSLREVTLKRAQIVNEELSIEMVRLVRNAASLKVHHVESHLAAVHIASAHHHALRPLDLKKHAWKAQAAFVADLLALFCFNHRIDQCDLLLFVFAAASIHHEQAL